MTLRRKVTLKPVTRVFIFLIRKGGSAKTTSAVNFAAALAYRFSRRVLLIDLDPQANATAHVGIAPATLDATINTLFTTVNVDPHRVIVPVSFLIGKHRFQFDVMPASRDLDETDLSMKATQVGLFRPIIDALRDDYDDIVIDTRPTRSLLTLAGMIPATHAVIPMEAGVFALDALKDTLQDIEEVRTGLNPNLHLVGVLPTRVREATNLSREILGSAIGLYDQLLIRYQDGDMERVLYIRDGVKLGEAPAYGVPGIVHEPRDNAAQDYLKLAEVLHAGEV